MKTPISYYGGKQNLVNDILSLIPEHEQYIEPFIGGGAVFWTKGPSPHEVINDLDGIVTNFYRVCKTEFCELQQMIIGTANSEYEYLKSKHILKNNEGTNIELAWAFWVQTNMSFGTKMFAGFAFGNSDRHARMTSNKKNSFTHKYAERLERVEIFCRDAVDLIKLKDTEYSFFYCDPPYFNSDCGHYDGYTIDDFEELLKVLSSINGKFLLSSYPSDILTEYVNSNKWRVKEKKQVISVDGRRKERKYKIESIVYNYEKGLTLF